MADLNKEIDVIAVEYIAKSRWLLARKHHYTELSRCVAVVIYEPGNNLIHEDQIIARQTTFNAFTFFSEEDMMIERIKFLKMVSPDEILTLNSIFEDDNYIKPATL